MILARHAEALLWAGRYLERAETTARCLNVATASIMHLVPADAEVEWEQLIAALGLVDEFGGADADLSVVSVRRFLLTDATSPGFGTTRSARPAHTTTGVITNPERVMKSSRRPSTAARSTATPTSSCISRSAVTSGVSSSSRRPPGSAHWPG